MHELSIAQALVEQVQALAQQEHAEHVAAVTVRIGALSGVNLEALQMAFPVAVEDTLAASARLLIETVPAQVRCRCCARLSEPDAPSIYCAACGSTEVEVVGGYELDIKSVELDVDPTWRSCETLE